MSEEVLDPFFSIIIPIYNTEEYLPRCLDSFFRQSFDCNRIEVVIVSDGSPNVDRCDEIVSAYTLEQKLEIKYIKLKENRGTHTARTVGVQQATGKYLLFIDPDDYLENDSLKIIYNDIQNNGDVDYIWFLFKNLYKNRSWDTSGFVENIHSPTLLEDILTCKVNHNVANKCFRTSFAKEAWNKMVDFYAYYNEDYYQMAILHYYAKTKRFLNEPLYVYVQNVGVTGIVKYTKEKLKKIILSIYNVDKYLILFYKENRCDAYAKFIEEYSELLYFHFIMHCSNVQDFIEIVNEMLDRTLIRRLMFKYLLEIRRDVVAHKNYEKCFILLRKIVGYSTHPKRVPNESLYALLSECDSPEKLTNAVGTNFSDDEVTNFFFDYISWSEKRLLFYKKHAKLISFVKPILRPFWRFYKLLFIK